ncbi:UNVERIFIED_CONTAM: hypothetical protein HDU68_011844 [Siphonaria sp. JEL0065]|nr:hypothetical protein HDU68_011844 [Siphonaria sp. JEL0065]
MDTSDSDSDYDDAPVPQPPQPQSKPKPIEPPVPQWSKSLKVVQNASLKGDRLKMSSTALQEIIHASTDHNQTLPSPLFFQLTNKQTGIKAYGSVREFTAENNHVVEVSPLLAESLQLGVATDGPTAKLNKEKGKGKGKIVQLEEEQDSGDAMRLEEEEQEEEQEDWIPDCTVKCVSLPKCEYLKIAPLDPSYLEIPDLRALLESHLRQNYSTVTESTTLSVSFIASSNSSTTNAVVHQFLITQCKPALACSCIDVDINLDVVPLDDGVAEEAVRRKFFGAGAVAAESGGDGVVEVVLSGVGVGGGGGDEVKGSVVGSVGNDEYRYFRVKNLAGKRNAGTYRVQVVAEGAGGSGGGSSALTGDCDVFVSTSMFAKPGLMDHDYYNADVGDSVVEFGVGGEDGEEDADEDVPFVYISVRGYSSNTMFRLTVSWTKGKVPASAPRNSNQSTTQTHENDDHVPEGQLKCENCYQSVPTRTFTMHQAFCARNNAICNRCRTAGNPVFVFKKEELETHWHCDSCDLVGTVAESGKHLEMEHTRHACVCGESLELKQVALHKRKQCPERLIICRYCRLRVRAGPKSMVAKDIYSGLGLCEHESVCGSRTIECIKCKANVQLKDVKMHAQFHEVQKQNQKAPLLCPNTQCSNRPNAQFPNPLGLCQPCFSPFWSPRHDPGNQKLTTKLLSAYHTQLTTGCGRTGHCVNPYCATGKKGEVMDATGGAVVAFEILKKSALFAGGGVKAEYSLCVLEAKNANRRAAANNLSEMGFQVSWAVKALEESGDNVEKALTWLLQNAPKLK